MKFYVITVDFLTLQGPTGATRRYDEEDKDEPVSKEGEASPVLGPTISSGSTGEHGVVRKLTA